MPIHCRYPKYKTQDYGQYPHLIGTTMAIMLGSAIVASAAVGTSMYGAAVEKTQQKKALGAQEAQQAKLLSYQEAQVTAAEAKAAGAEALAAQTAAETLKKKRRAQTQTILTSPLGIPSEANLGMSTLLGGGQ